jgi:hypothetical protein
LTVRSVSLVLNKQELRGQASKASR